MVPRSVGQREPLGSLAPFVLENWEAVWFTWAMISETQAEVI